METQPPSSLSNQSYWKQREALVKADLNRMLGNDIVLSPDEEVVNDTLMKLKNQEINQEFRTLDLLVPKSFVESKTKIDQSPVFKFIQKLPKGAVLHAHDIGIASVKWLISELTYWDDLYMCHLEDGSLSFRFFNSPDDTHDWVLVSDARTNYSSPQDFDDFLFSKLSLCPIDYDQNTYKDINSAWKEFWRIIRSLSGILGFRKAWEAYLYRALEEFKSDQVSYVELRSVITKLYEKSGEEYDEIQVVEIFENVVKKFTSKHSDRFFGVRIIFSIRRTIDVEEAWKSVDLISRLKKRFPSIVVGFDIAGQEDMGKPLTFFIDHLLTLSSHDPPIQFIFHSGETFLSGMSSDGNLYDAVLLNVTRIGHGYAIAKHPELIQMAKEKDIPVEICPISNQILKLVSNLRNHPASYLAADSFPLVVSSDTSGLWEGSPLSHDFYEFFMSIAGAKADLRVLKKLALNSVRYSSLNSEEKEEFQSIWELQWDNFIKEQIAEHY